MVWGVLPGEWIIRWKLQPSNPDAFALSGLVMKTKDALGLLGLTSASERVGEST